MAEQFAKAWEGFAAGEWQNEVNVRDFIQKNYAPYEAHMLIYIVINKSVLHLRGALAQQC